ncbi:R2-like ligand binding oxidase [bacterium HR15]|nr:R2-like ligand binding oxidase [bacterium HR15]
MQDEARHIAFGVYLLSRLIVEHGDAVWEAIQNKMNEPLPYAPGVVQESFEPYKPNMPFWLQKEEFVQYAMEQCIRRERLLAHARRLTLEQLYQETGAAKAEAAELTRAMVQGYQGNLCLHHSFSLVGGSPQGGRNYESLSEMGWFGGCIVVNGVSRME